MPGELLATASPGVAVVKVPHRHRDGDSDLLLLLLTLLGTRAGTGARLLLLGRVLILRSIALILIFGS